MSLDIMCVWEKQTKKFFLDWLDETNKHKVLIAYDPSEDYSGCLLSGRSIVFREWGGHRWYFSVPEGVVVQPTDDWLSASNNLPNGKLSVKSQMLYPWYWNFDGYDIVCQIAPPDSVSSINSHNKTVEVFAPVQNDGQTFLRVGSEEKPLVKQVRIGLGVPHQIVRKGGGYSVQLLKMMGPIRFPDREDHVFGE